MAPRQLRPTPGALIHLIRPALPAKPVNLAGWVAAPTPAQPRPDRGGAGVARMRRSVILGLQEIPCHSASGPTGVLPRVPRTVRTPVAGDARSTPQSWLPPGGRLPSSFPWFGLPSGLAPKGPPPGTKEGPLQHSSAHPSPASPRPRRRGGSQNKTKRHFGPARGFVPFCPRTDGGPPPGPPDGADSYGRGRQ